MLKFVGISNPAIVGSLGILAEDLRRLYYAEPTI
jgi:hypothetical protein